jgi:ribosome-binding protein aMBF1 (putative translation factor)
MRSDEIEAMIVYYLGCELCGRSGRKIYGREHEGAELRLCEECWIDLGYRIPPRGGTGVVPNPSPKIVRKQEK